MARVNIAVTANATAAIRELHRVSGAIRSVDGTSRTATVRTSRLGSAIKSGFRAAAFSAIPIIGALGFATKRFVEAAIDAEKSTANLKNALKNTGNSWSQYGQEINNVITKQSLLSAFDDEDLTDTLSNLIRTTGSVTTSFKLNALAADIARARHVSLETASKALEKAWNGQTAGLTRLGIQVDKNASRAEVLAALQRKFAGAAAAYGRTAAGSWERLGIVWENLKESLGTALIPIITQLANTFSKWLIKAQQSGELQRKLNAIIRGTIAVVHAVADAVRVAIGWWNRHGATVTRVMNTGVNHIQAVTSAVRQMISVIQGVNRQMNRVGAGFTSFKQFALSALFPIITQFRLLKFAADQIVNAVHAIGSAISSLPSLPSIPGGSLLDKIRGATGGIVTQPTFALIGEKGPEAVIPLNRTPGSSPLPSGLTSGTVNHNNIEINVYGGDPRQVGKAIDQALVRAGIA